MAFNNLSAEEKALEILRNMPVEELPYMMARYTGRDNRLLCLKKFGCELSRQQIEEILFERTVLGADSND